MTQDNAVNFIDNILKNLLAKRRIDYYKKISNVYSQRTRGSQPLGFESILSSFLFCDLYQIYSDNVFQEWPTENGKIDIRLETTEANFMFELKMYYSKDEGAYEKDFCKLYKELQIDSQAIAIHAQVQIYKNSNFPAHNYLKDKGKILSQDYEYWHHYSEIGQREDIHIARLIFSKREIR